MRLTSVCYQESEQYVMVFRGKSVVVTGGASGIALQLCKQLLANEVPNLAVIDVQENEEIKKLQKAHPTQNLLFFKMDVSDKQGLEEVYGEIFKEFGTIDIAVHVAGIFNDLDVFKTVTVNLGGMINSTFAAMKFMSKENGGSGGIIANMASVVGLDPHFMMPVYTSTKHGIVGFTRAMSHDFYFNRSGIKFITLCPGATITQQFTNFPDKLLYPDMGDESYKLLDRLNKQSASDVSRGILSALEKCENGAVVVIECGKLHPMDMKRYWTWT